MADRQPDTNLRLLFDGPDDESLSVSVVDALGDEVVPSTSATHVGRGRHVATVSPSTTRRVDGLWTATWTDDTSGNTWTQAFTVDADGYTNKYDVRIQTAARLRETHEGVITDAAYDTISDRLLLGGSGDHVGNYIVLAPNSNEAGITQRIREFNGSVLTLSGRYSEEPSPGTRYVILPLSPFEVDRAIENAINMLGHTAYIRVMAERIVPSETIEGVSDSLRYKRNDKQYILDLPAGWTHLHEIYHTDTVHGADHRVRFEQWEMLHGRRVVVHLSANDNDTFTLYGSRSARTPVWDDSQVDLNPAFLVPAAASNLLVSRSRGPSTDPDEVIRRAVLSFEEIENHHRRFSRRPPHGSRKILD